MNKICQNCKENFLVDEEDQAFYTSMNVPPPTWCAPCRFVRRLSFLNWVSLKNRACDSCNKKIISIHKENSDYKVFCNECWWNDSWDGTEYGMDYDPNRNFFEQMLELKNKSNFMSLENLYTTLVNSPYVNATGYMKDCYMVFNADYAEKTAYTMFLNHTNECLDNFRIAQSELCYECVGIHKSYKCIYSNELDLCASVLFSYGLSGCTDCFGCVNLRNKSYYIYNIPYSRDEYLEKIKAMNLDTRLGIAHAYRESRKFWMTQPRRAVIGNGLNVNTTGDYVYESKNTQDAYMITSAEDCRYVAFLTMAKTVHCYDYINWGAGAENLYECVTVGDGAYNNKFCVQCWPQAMNLEYCLYANNSKDCFGCVNLKRKQYCILNKQYTKEEYEILKTRIIQDMKDNPYTDKAGRVYAYGELFPYELSPFAYNETMAQFYAPLTKEEAESKAIPWFDENLKKHAITMKNADIPDSLAEIHETIKSEILECGKCANGFNISELEVYLHTKIGVPLPSDCWRCRFKRRFDSVNLPKLYDRNCQKCSIEIKTSYFPERPEIVYCEKCYQQEIF